MNIFDVLIVQPIFNLLVLIYSAIPGADFGVALIIVTVLIRFLMWPLVKKQLHQTKAMRKLQPELQKLKERHKGDRQAQGMAMMELYKTHNVSPFRSIGILLLQLPIFIALYRVIRIFTMHREDIEKFTYDFLQNIPVIKEIIANPDSFNEQLLGIIDLTDSAFGEHGINIAILILVAGAAALQYFISKQTMPQEDSGKKLRDLMAEAGDGKQPDQAEMSAIMTRNMIKFMPIMMFVVMANLPSALSLYYAVSNVIAFFQQRHILQQDETELAKLAAKPASRAKNAKKATVVKKPDTKPAASKPKPKTSKPAAKPTTKSSGARKPVAKSTSRAKMKSGTTVTRISAKDSRKR